MATNILQTIGKDVNNLLEGRHQSSKASDGEEVHVFAIAGPPVFGSSDPGRYDFSVEVPLWGVTWILNGYMDAKLAMNATFSVRVPIMGTFKLSDVKGNLADGIAVTFDISMLNGQAKFYISDKWLYINLSAVVFGQAHGPAAFGLFPLPA
ncbi:hypothetical protein C8J57DRAFT_1308588 [Mycena rebaudengoi]|nr:hypothetical protein C8J57DRAFT_1308588 [Mycena rebaudengoi]